MLPIPRWKDGLLWIFGLLLFAAFLGVFAPRDEVQAQVGPPNQILCNQTAILNAAAAGTTQLVVGVTGQRVYMCGWHFTTNTTAGTFQLLVGTGATCTTPTNFTPAVAVSSTAPSSDHIEFASLNGAAGQSFCVTTVTSATITGQIWFSQF